MDLLTPWPFKDLVSSRVECHNLKGRLPYEARMIYAVDQLIQESGSLRHPGHTKGQRSFDVPWHPSLLPNSLFPY